MKKYSVHEVFRTLCFEKQLVKVDYFLDKMPQYEAMWLLDNIDYCGRDAWDRWRTIVSMWSNKSYKKIKFTWDDDDVEEKSGIRMSVDELSKMIKRSQLRDNEH